MLIGYRAGDMYAPQLAVTEALSVEAAHFVECVSRGATPLTGGEAGLRVVRLLEAAVRIHGRSGPSRQPRESRSTHDSVRRPAGPVPGAQARDRRRRPARARQRAVHPRAGGRGLRDGLRRLLPHHRSGRREQRHERAAPGAARRRRRPGRRGHHRPVHVRRHRRGHRVQRRDARVRGRRARLLDDGSGADRARHHAEDQGHHPGPPVWPARRHGSDPRDRAAAQPEGDRGRLPVARLGIQGPALRLDGRSRLLQLLSGQEPRRLR